MAAAAQRPQVAQPIEAVVVGDPVLVLRQTRRVERVAVADVAVGSRAVHFAHAQAKPVVGERVYRAIWVGKGHEVVFVILGKDKVSREIKTRHEAL